MEEHAHVSALAAHKKQIKPLLEGLWDERVEIKASWVWRYLKGGEVQKLRWKELRKVEAPVRII